ncbi:Y-family DNA polymerase [Arcicella aquatica]|uniref:Y-family DNA polymerase n=1 Tax=Arcicella aquatica TaxID=217141 RepID=A0ABU5QJM4_9BACT|nr:Y-family DNA polymerase [Arcicella aquatica]MEA5257135.1 Y-family DNA polymerase [Arcicella aquatica]
MFALVDCNNFYASCERVFQPKLRNQPIAVLSNNDGCVISRSNEAKKAGVPMGAPAYKFEDFFNKNNIHVVSSNYALYGDMSNRVMNLLAEFTPEIELYSIDEAFLKFDGFEKYFDFQKYGNEIRYQVTKGTGIPISVGIAPTKALSKVANNIAKKFPEKTGNVYVIDSDEKRIKALKWLAIEGVWGIGYRLAKRLKAAEVHTAFDFTNCKEEWVKKEMGVVGLRLYKELQGISCLDLDEVADKRNIATTRSFETNYKDYELVKERIITFTVSCAEKLRKQKSCCNAIVVFLRTNAHRKELEQYSKSQVLALPYPTNSNIELAKFATEALDMIFREGFEYKKAGVIVTDLTPENAQQISLFQNSNPKHKKLMEAVDNINRKTGTTIVKLATQDLQRTWKMKQEKLSKRYTTRLADIIRVKA